MEGSRFPKRSRSDGDRIGFLFTSSENRVKRFPCMEDVGHLIGYLYILLKHILTLHLPIVTCWDRCDVQSVAEATVIVVLFVPPDGWETISDRCTLVAKDFHRDHLLCLAVGK